MSPHNTSVFMLSNISAVASMSGASTYSLLYSLHISTTILLDSSPGKNFIPDRHLICLKITGTISKRCCKEAPQQPKATSVLSGYISERCDTEAPQPTKYASISAAEKGNDTKTVLAHLPRLRSYSWLKVAFVGATLKDYKPLHPLTSNVNWREVLMDRCLGQGEVHSTHLTNS